MAVEENFLLKTNRLCLRPLRLDDLPSVQRIGRHPLVAPMLASIGTPWPKAAVQAWITARQYRGKPGFCALIVLPERTVIGVAGLLCLFYRPSALGLGICVRSHGRFFSIFYAKIRSF